MNKKISLGAAVALVIIAMALTVSVTMVVSMRQFNYKLSNVNQRQVMFDYITEVDKAIRQHYVGEIKEEDLRTALAKGYLNGIGDPYAEYLTPAEYRKETERLSGKWTGFGIEVSEQADGSAVVAVVHKNSAADKAGVQKGDVIVAMDSADAGFSEVKAKLGSAEKVMLTVHRGEETIAFELSASTYTVISVESRMIDSVGYIRIRHFYSNTAEQFKEAMTSLEEQGAQSYLFDLRNNEGDVVDAAAEVVGMLLPRGTYAKRIVNAGAVQEYVSTGSMELTKPSVTLINERTECGAELFAGVLQELKKTTVVGQQSAGHGTIQELYNVTSDGSAIRLSIANLALISGGTIEGKGVAPETEVSLSEEQERRFPFLTEADDPQMIAALGALKGGPVTTSTTVPAP